ncbi:ubiquitin-2 like Rad60 SUMO-like-domain-containing protein [Catenaria anguillulae PL171]|uniref:Ubiquitin-2 like Rad60 SUMO-like-domain-containing protein n=1 Tax=Catenaria anguillulae PL171 TaxID=765915 RepID=A0A1Y2H964_9FUNG|nr:ubiquitin-2 like Rad60 SUMO-like-domain-containing protein [Catenaria anguillulae PL171]
MSDAPKTDPSTVTQVSLKLRDHTGSEIEFKVKSTTKFSKVAKAYAEKKGLTLADLRFDFDGNRIRPEQDETIDDLDLQDGDTIDVATAQHMCFVYLSLSPNLQYLHFRLSNLFAILTERLRATLKYLFPRYWLARP